MTSVAAAPRTTGGPEQADVCAAWLGCRGPATSVISLEPAPQRRAGLVARRLPRLVRVRAARARPTTRTMRAARASDAPALQTRRRSLPCARLLVGGPVHLLRRGGGARAELAGG